MAEISITERDLYHKFNAPAGTSNHGHLSHAERFHVHELVTPATAFDVFLRFRDAGVEDAFWKTFMHYLSKLNMVIRTALLAYHGIVLVWGLQLAASHDGANALLYAHVLFSLTLVFIQLASCRPAWLRRNVGYRSRAASDVAFGVLHCVQAGCMSLVIARSGSSSSSNALVSSLPRPSAGTHFVALLLIANYLAFFSVLRFSLLVPLHTVAALPVLLHAAACLARHVLSNQDLRSTLCTTASWGPIRQGACNPLAPQLVAYSVSEPRRFGMLTRARSACSSIVAQVAASVALVVASAPHRSSQEHAWPGSDLLSLSHATVAQPSTCCMPGTSSGT